jgi:hypothetical protein
MLLISKCGSGCPDGVSVAGVAVDGAPVAGAGAAVPEVAGAVAAPGATGRSPPVVVAVVVSVEVAAGGGGVGTGFGSAIFSTSTTTPSRRITRSFAKNMITRFPTTIWLLGSPLRAIT